MFRIFVFTILFCFITGCSHGILGFGDNKDINCQVHAIKRENCQ